MFPSSVTKTGADGKPVTSIEPVNAGSDIQSIFFDMWRADHPDVALNDVPGDLVTASASGLDPDITLANAEFQLDRVAAKWADDKKRDAADVRKEIEAILQEKAHAPWGGLIGEKLVNVLEVNLELHKRLRRSGLSRSASAGIGRSRRRRRETRAENAHRSRLRPSLGDGAWSTGRTLPALRADPMDTSVSGPRTRILALTSEVELHRLLRSILEPSGCMAVRRSAFRRGSGRQRAVRHRDRRSRKLDLDLVCQARRAYSGRGDHRDLRQLSRGGLHRHSRSGRRTISRGPFARRIWRRACASPNCGASRRRDAAASTAAARSSSTSSIAKSPWKASRSRSRLSAIGRPDAPGEQAGARGDLWRHPGGARARQLGRAIGGRCAAPSFACGAGSSATRRRPDLLLTEAGVGYRLAPEIGRRNQVPTPPRRGAGIWRPLVLTLAGSFEISADARACSGRGLSDRRLHGGCVRQSEDLSHPIIRPGRARALSSCGSRPGGRAEVVRICDLDGRVWRRLSVGLLRPAAAAGLSATQSAGLSRRAARSRLQHRGQLHHQRQLAGLWRRDDAQPSCRRWSASPPTTSSIRRRRPRSRSR